MINPLWLSGNDAGIEFLSECFGFDQLELRLLGTAPGDIERTELRNNLAKLVEVGGGDPATYEALTKALIENQRQTKAVERCRNLGIAIQESIKRALEERGLNLKLIDRGYDYEVTGPADDLFEDASFRLEVGSYFLEVKATTHGDARLTPLQAATAATESSRYVLCVVDLRGIPAERLESTWTARDVEPLAKIVTDIGPRAKQTWVLVDMAKSQPIGISNETALRYTITPSIWSSGCSIGAWVDSIAR